MKKNNAGYALPFVLVVMTVLCLVATSAMTASLRNLQSQQALIKRMENQYAAEGEIEKIVAQLSDAEEMKTLLGADEETIQERIRAICGEDVTITFDDIILVTDDKLECPFQLETKGGTMIKCGLKLEGAIQKTTDETEGTDGTTTFEVKVTYTSYEIGGAA